MVSWCFMNNYIAPPANFPAPKPMTQCTVPLAQWCSSKTIAASCGVILNKSDLEKKNS